MELNAMLLEQMTNKLYLNEKNKGEAMGFPFILYPIRVRSVEGRFFRNAEEGWKKDEIIREWYMRHAFTGDVPVFMTYVYVFFRFV